MNRDVREALRVLAAADAEIEGSSELEARVRSAFRAHRRRRMVRHALAWTIAAAAIVAVMSFAVRRPEAPVVAKMVREAPALTTPSAPVVAAPKPVRRVGRRPREIVTDFFQLIEAPPPLDRGELVRVMVPAATMRRVGLPVNEDRLADQVKADVLVSEDGLATAIRFVRSE